MSERRNEADWPPRPADFEQDLEPRVEREEREKLVALAVRLTEDRPVPSPALRSAVRSRLLGQGARTPPARIGTLIFGYAASGSLLLVVAAAGLLGIGPFAA
jgi:hypothetical protein